VTSSQGDQFVIAQLFKR